MELWPANHIINCQHTVPTNYFKKRLKTHLFRNVLGHSAH